MDDRILRVKFGVDRVGTFARLIDHVGDVDTVELDNAIYMRDKNWIESITICGGSKESIGDGLHVATDIDIVELRRLSAVSETYYLVGFVVEQEPFILTSLTKNDVIPYRLVAENDRLEIVAALRDWNHLKELANQIEDEFKAFELLETSPTEGTGSPLGFDSMKRFFRGKFTESQLELLETAYRMGYFDVPQEATSDKVAAELDISQPTFSEQLRRTESKLFGLIFGESR